MVSCRNSSASWRSWLGSSRRGSAGALIRSSKGDLEFTRMLRFIYGLTVLLGSTACPSTGTRKTLSFYTILGRESNLPTCPRRELQAAVQPYMLGRGREFCHGLTPFLPRQ